MANNINEATKNNEFTVGDDIEVFDFLTNTWRKALVEDVDFGEREMLIQFENGIEEWINIDQSKIQSYDSSTKANCKSDTTDSINKSCLDNSDNKIECAAKEKTDKERESEIPVDDNEKNSESERRVEESKEMLQEYTNSEQCNESFGTTDVVDNSSDVARSIEPASDNVTPTASVETEDSFDKATTSLGWKKLKHLPKSNDFPESYANDAASTCQPVVLTEATAEKFSPASSVTSKTCSAILKMSPDDKSALHTRSSPPPRCSTEKVDAFKNPEIKLPRLKIKLTRSSTTGLDGYPSSRDTFVVTEAPEVGHSEDDLSKTESSEAGKDVDNANTMAGLSELQTKRTPLSVLKYARPFDKNKSKPLVHLPIKRPLFHRPDEDENLTKLAIKHNIRRKIENKWSPNSSYESHYTSGDELNAEQPDKKRIKTLLPKARLSEASTKTVHTASNQIVNFPSIISSTTGNNVTLTSPVVSDRSGFICPVKDCRKQFRRENLLVMHIKYYHTEYQKLLARTPNVADLAYARTVGETISSTQSEFLQEISRLEEDRSKELEQKVSNEDRHNVGEEPISSTHINAPNSISQSATSVNVGNDDKLKNAQEKVTSEAPPSSSLGGPLSSALSSLSSPSSLSPSSPYSSLFSPAPTVSNVPSPQKADAIKDEQPSALSQSNSILCSLLKSNPLTLNTKSEYNNAVSKNLPVASVSEDKTTSSRNKKAAHLNSREIINCPCGYAGEDGLMIQCEICLCWQHGACNNIEQESEVPADYVCSICQNPRRQRSSQRYSYTNHWFTKGKLPRFNASQTDLKLVNAREDYLKKTYKLLGQTFTLEDHLHTLKLKNHIMGQHTNHPKLYLWSNSWNEKKLEEEKRNLDSRKKNSAGPVPEVAIDTSVCRRNLLEHIKEEMDRFDNNLTKLERLVDDLDDDETDDETEDEDDPTVSYSSNAAIGIERTKELLNLI